MMKDIASASRKNMLSCVYPFFWSSPYYLRENSCIFGGKHPINFRQFLNQCVKHGLFNIDFYFSKKCHKVKTKPIASSTTSIRKLQEKWRGPWRTIMSLECVENAELGFVSSVISLIFCS